jgi:hypothetical protein
MRTSYMFVSALGAAAFALAIGSVARAADPVAKCQDGNAKASRNIANQEQKKNRKCVKDGAGDISACVNAEGAKSATKRGKLTDLFATDDKCDPVPGLGVNGGNGGNDTADGTEQAAGDILRGVFGDPVDGIVAGDKCQDAIAKRAGKAYDAALKGFRKCIKDAAPLANQGAVDTCVGTGVNDAKTAKFINEKLLKDMGKKCTFASPPAGMEDGDCSACGDAATCTACVGVIVRCQACLAANNSSNGTADCDTLDDGDGGNGSCGSPAPTECPIAAAGRYTITQVAGGQLQVASIDGGTPGGFPFPTGGIVVQDVSAASLPDCVHDTVVPFPAGFSAPIFCIPGLNFSVQVTQSGCGIGQIDSNGGSDFTVTEAGDTSDSLGDVNGSCGLPHAGCVNGSDASVRVDITVGNSAADTCLGGGADANSIVIIPVSTQTWLATDFSCPDADGVFDPGTDTDILLINQNLDFTTDTSTSSWSDIDADGCSIAGAGPAAGFSRTGVCLDIVGGTVTTAATGTIGSDGSPLFDLTFATRLPNSVSGPAAFGGATCASPPVVTFPTGLTPGFAVRCIP